jgi:hypothetical protein
MNKINHNNENDSKKDELNYNSTWGGPVQREGGRHNTRVVYEMINNKWTIKKTINSDKKIIMIKMIIIKMDKMIKVPEAGP